MLAALLLNLEEELKTGPIWRGQSMSVSRDVHKAAHQIRELLWPVYIPEAVRPKVRKAIEKITEYVGLPDVERATSTLSETQQAIAALEQLQEQIKEPEWLVELRLVITRLITIRARIVDDEEALLLLM